MRHAAFALLIGCSSSAVSPDARPIETGPFIPLLCTNGAPGTQNCPMNRVDLSTIAGSEFDFIVKRPANDLELSAMVFHAGPSGLYIEHPLFFSAMQPDAGDPFASTVLNIMPGQQAALGTTTLVGPYPSSLNIRFTLLDSYRP